jgi:hypothetical protein
MTSIMRRTRPLAAIALLAAGALLALGLTAARGGMTAQAAARPDVTHFKLVANPKFANCLARYPGDPARAPRADVTVQRGNLNDTLTLHIHDIKPNLAFDLFTVQRSSLLADGKPNPAFTNFGMAWYQSDVQADNNGNGTVRVRTILLDQIFGFDPDVNLAPTNTFQVGFWFNDPNDAAACGFDVTKPTPFNGEHRAGPLAMISLPDATTGLGPLCVNPDTSVTPARCNP